MNGEANSRSIMGSQGRCHRHAFSSAAKLSHSAMDIHLHTGKGVTRLNKDLKGIITPTAEGMKTQEGSQPPHPPGRDPSLQPDVVTLVRSQNMTLALDVRKGTSPTDCWLY